MKLILALALTICLFACKQKEEIISPSIVGTYQKTFVQDKMGGTFRDILSDYDNFTETATLVVTQTGVNIYNLQVTLTGVAKKGNTTPVNYGFTTEMTPYTPITSIGNTMLFKGTYNNISPSSLNFSPDKQTYAEVKYNGNSLNIILTTTYKKDASFLLYAVLPKVK